MLNPREKRYVMSKGKEEALARWQKGRNLIQNQTLYPPETLRGLKQTLCTPGPTDLTETETELCLSVSCKGTGQQWPDTGVGALDESELGMAKVRLEEVLINPTKEPQELTQDWEIDSWRAQTDPCGHKEPGEGSSDPTRDRSRLARECPEDFRGSVV